jgi:hypothetical protein
MLSSPWASRLSTAPSNSFTLLMVWSIPLGPEIGCLKYGLMEKPIRLEVEHGQD